MYFTFRYFRFERRVITSRAMTIGMLAKMLCGYMLWEWNHSKTFTGQLPIKICPDTKVWFCLTIIKNYRSTVTVAKAPRLRSVFLSKSECSLYLQFYTAGLCNEAIINWNVKHTWIRIRCTCTWWPFMTSMQSDFVLKMAIRLCCHKLETET